MIYPLTNSITVLGKVIIKPEKSFSFLSYLVHGACNILIDTVPERSAAVFLEELASCVPLDKLDALILNHSEEDHSGALGALLVHRPDLPIYCTPACQRRLSPTHPDANFHTVETDSFLNLGPFSFHFTHTPGLHWDDNMTSYLEQECTLFSNDLFGQSLGAECPLDTEFSRQKVLDGAKAYFEQVMSSATQEERAVVFGLADPDLLRIAPGHGVILEEFLDDVLDYYEQVL